MGFNLDTYDETGRDLEQHRLTPTSETYSFNIEITTTDRITDAVIRDRLTKFVHNLGNDSVIVIDHHVDVTSRLDNLDF